MKYSIEQTVEYRAWVDRETEKSRVQIMGRIQRIENEGHFGDVKNLGEDLSELRWKNGRRLYFAWVGVQDILLLIGGNKNGQKKDIKEASLLHRKYEDAKTQTWPSF